MKKPNIRIRVNGGNVAAKSQAPAKSEQPPLQCTDPDAGLDADLLEFAMDLKSPGRTLLAERFERWAKQLKDSVSVMSGLRIGEANPNN